MFDFLVPEFFASITENGKASIWRLSLLFSSPLRFPTTFSPRVALKPRNWTDIAGALLRFPVDVFVEPLVFFLD